MPHSIMRVDIAGRDVSRYLKTLIRREGFNFRSTAEFEIVRSIKEKVCYLATNPQKEESVETEKFAYTLPDGKTLEVTINSTQHEQIFRIDFYRLAKLVSELQKFCSDPIYWARNVKAFMMF